MTACLINDQAVFQKNKWGACISLDWPFFCWIVSVWATSPEKEVKKEIIFGGEQGRENRPTKAKSGRRSGTKWLHSISLSPLFLLNSMGFQLWSVSIWIFFMLTFNCLAAAARQHLAEPISSHHPERPTSPSTPRSPSIGNQAAAHWITLPTFRT